METFEAIRNRRSIRRFLDKEVDKSAIQKIIQAGLYAPSSKNCQPWQFKVLTGKEKNNLANLVEENRQIPEWIKYDSTPVTCEAIRQAPYLIIVLNKGSRSGGEREVRKTNEIAPLIAETLSIGASIQNMLLTATNLGLATLWCGDLRNAKYEAEQYLNTKYDLIAGVAVGYAAEQSSQKKVPTYKF